MTRRHRASRQRREWPCFHRIAIRISGLAGITGALCWTLGDALIVGGNATPADYRC